MFQDPGGTIWAATLTEGLLQIDGDRIRSFTVNDGLPANNVSAVCRDRDGVLWIGTTAGIVAFDHDRILPGSQVGGPVVSLACTPDGDVWVAPGAAPAWRMAAGRPVALPASLVAIHVDEVPDGISGYRGGMLGTQNSHDLIHQTDRNNGSLRSDTQGIAVVKKYHLVYAQLFANFLDLLKNTPESDGGSLLDHTAVLWCGEISEGGHGTNNLRWMIAGNCQGAFKTGRLLIWDDYDRSEFRSSAVAPSHADLFVSLAKAMGVDTDTFGIAGACKGPIASLAG